MTAIADLVTACARLEATFDGLFATLGAWATDDPDLDDPTRRWLATMAHRHARHARLCAERAPAVPLDPAPVEPLTGPASPDLTWYRGVIEQVRAALDEMADRTDPDLDPATVFTARLIADTLPAA